MPVRSRGSLLAGSATLAGILLVGLGCHSSRSDRDSFSLPNQSSQSKGGPLSRHGASTVIASTESSAPTGPAIPPARYSGGGMVSVNPVVEVQTAGLNREVIASSNEGDVQPVSAESGRLMPVPQPLALGIEARTALNSGRLAPAPMPVGTPTPLASGGPSLDGNNAPPPEGTSLPQPRPIVSQPSSGSSMVVNGPLTPPMPHDPSANVPREFEKMALPTYVVEPPDILLIQASNRITLRLQPISGQHLVAPDGTVNLGIYGKIHVAGMTLDQIGTAVATRLLEIMPGLLGKLKEVDEKGEERGQELRTIFQQSFTSIELIKREMQVDVLSYNSKFYYVITDGGGYGQQVYPFPIRGNETVLDAMANINGLPFVANKKRIWVARATRPGQPPKILPVDWMATAKYGSSATNYQLMPGDRVYVDSNHLIKADSFLAKMLSPVQRVLGVTLLGASTVNSIKLGTLSGSGLGGVGLFR
jgi:polysaccharide export outer membrane protein